MFCSDIENNVLQSSNNHPYWRPAILNYVFLLHFQMQTWKGFLSKVNSIITKLWSKLIIYSLNALAHQNKPINTFHREHIQKCVNCWCNTKKRWLREGKCKVFEKQKSKIFKWLYIDFSNLFRSSKFDSWQWLTLSAPRISKSWIKIKINLIFYFHTSLWCLKRFYGGL